ncbi:porin [Vibrio sp. nBUS_14]|uniref:porin n=1 Tax=Vibrio sp. nBUS_14 TaxID=3395321 RepID=UPI003EBFED27
MKKTLLALAVMTAAGTANAAVMYDDNDVTVTIKGDIDVHYIKTSDKNQDAQIAVDDADFGFGLKYNVTDELAVGGALNIDGDASIDEDGQDENQGIEVNEVYVGLMYGPNTLTFGEQYTVRDDSGIGGDYEFGLAGAVDNSDFYGPQVVKYVYDAGEMFYGAASFSAYENGAKGRVDGDSETDIRLGARVADFDFTVYLGKTKKSQVDEDHYILEGRYTLDALELAATYAASTTDNGVAGTADVDTDVIGVAATYTLSEQVSFAAGYSIMDNDTAGSKEVGQGYVNTTYNFTSQVWSYAEVGFTDEDNKDTAYVVGMGVKF